MVAPITDILFPSEEARKRLCCAVTTSANNAGAPSVVTLTIANSYPPIDQTIPCPVLAILLTQNDDTLIVDGNEVFLVTGACAGVPDSAGEFQVTGARTIDYWKLANETGIAMIFYIAEGSGNKT